MSDTKRKSMILYVVLGYEKWEGLETNTGIPMGSEPWEPGCNGFLPVFETREAAEEAYPEHKVLAIESNGN